MEEGDDCSLNLDPDSDTADEDCDSDEFECVTKSRYLLSVMVDRVAKSEGVDVSKTKSLILKTLTSQRRIF